jgi:hypothetical protein
MEILHKLVFTQEGRMMLGLSLGVLLVCTLLIRGLLREMIQHSKLTKALIDAHANAIKEEVDGLASSISQVQLIVLRNERAKLDQRRIEENGEELDLEDEEETHALK